MKKASPFSLGVMLGGALACGSSGHGFDGQDSGYTAPGAPGGNDASLQGADDGSNAPPMLGGDGGPTVDGCSGVHCSGDLTSVLDCSDTVVMTCAAGTGCAGGTCVSDPCAAAVLGAKSAVMVTGPFQVLATYAAKPPPPHGRGPMTTSGMTA